VDGVLPLTLPSGPLHSLLGRCPKPSTAAAAAAAATAAAAARKGGSGGEAG